ncbi:hypothetical protein G1K57_04530 [Tenacibaculum finnmarkense]|uniref:hypothetical protein n=1 Tax=Tenacibaculum finnmarkense TaxID=2781243 RepID=UPI001EFB6DD4|nr:hypothetical protein [Tenacibaculum finnmarkense]MCG8807432.1 hypothetical protein [Tenacibaculum finnmarkense]MCG8817651.1 hypothetical protein [Tenacibaculum finnmarkense]
MNDGKFILELLNSKNTTEKQKQKIIELTKRDGNFHVLERLLKLEEVVFNKKKKYTKKNVLSKSKKHSPKEMVKFLYMFSLDDKFKWFTHKADFNTDNISYLNIIEQFNDNLKGKVNLSSLNLNTLNFIINFITDKNKLGFNVVYPKYTNQLSYSNEEVYELIKQGINPFDIVIDNTKFSNVISRFGHAIRFRSDDVIFKFQTLFKKFVRDKISVDFLPKYEKGFKQHAEEVDIYIDLNNFFRGLAVVLEWIIKSKSKSSEVTFDLQSEKEFYCLTIFHRNSYFTMNIDNAKFKGNSGDWHTLKKYWFSVVDWKMEADFKTNENKQSFEIICLNKDSKQNMETFEVSENQITPLKNTVGGVKHIIKLYKTT